jgi:hypothetical protein
MIDPAQLLPALSEDQERLAERVAELAQERLGLGSRHPVLVAAACAHMLADVLAEVAAQDGDAIEPMTLAVLNEVVQRITALTMARRAVARAMAAAKNSN